MKRKDVVIGSVYVARVSGTRVRVRVDADLGEDTHYHNGKRYHRGWTATNLTTKRTVRIRSAQRLTALEAPRAPTAAAQEALFSRWLREHGHVDLCPANRDDSPLPLTSRIAELQARGGTNEQINQLRDLWTVWAGRAPKAPSAPSPSLVPALDQAVAALEAAGPVEPESGEDLTEAPRREMVAEINAAPGERAALEAQHGQVWDTAQLGSDFDVVGFMAPFVVVRRKADGKKGSLCFQHLPRYYFTFVED